MSAPRTEIRDLEDLFAYELAGVYDMEVKLVDALGELSQLATNDNLSAGFDIHRTETRAQVERAKAAFEALGREPIRRDNLVADGLLEERARFDAEATDEELRNLNYLRTAIVTERAEIASYEQLLLIAERGNLGDDVTTPLADTLEQEMKTLRKLQGLAGESDLETLWNELTDL